jgi:hypothetical protein
MESNKRVKLSDDELEVMYGLKQAGTWRDLNSTPDEVKEEFKEPIHFRIEFETTRNLKEGDKAIRCMEYDLVYYPEADKLVLLDPENYFETPKLTKDDKLFLVAMDDITDDIVQEEDDLEMPDGIMFRYTWPLEDQKRMLHRDELMKYVYIGYHVWTLKENGEAIVPDVLCPVLRVY